jgi:hypothetical protein
MELKTPAEVYSFIRTRQSIYNLFQAHKATVLSAVLRNSVHPAVLKDFLLANRAHSVCSLRARREYISRKKDVGLPPEAGKHRRLRLRRISEHFDLARQDALTEIPQDLAVITLSSNCGSLSMDSSAIL